MLAREGDFLYGLSLLISRKSSHSITIVNSKFYPEVTETKSSCIEWNWYTFGDQTSFVPRSMLFITWFCLLIPFLKGVGSYIDYSGMSPFILADVLQQLKHGKLILGICFQAVVSMRFSWNRPRSVQSPVPPASTASGHKSFTLIGSSECREGHLCSPFSLGRGPFGVLKNHFQWGLTLSWVSEGYPVS